GLDLPRGLQIDFSRIVQEDADRSGEEITAKRLWELFDEAYLGVGGAVEALRRQVDQTGGEFVFHGDLAVEGRQVAASGTGGTPAAAVAAALREAGLDVELAGYGEHA